MPAKIHTKHSFYKSALSFFLHSTAHGTTSFPSIRREWRRRDGLFVTRLHCTVSPQVDKSKWVKANADACYWAFQTLECSHISCLLSETRRSCWQPCRHPQLTPVTNGQLHSNARGINKLWGGRGVCVSSSGGGICGISLLAPSHPPLLATHRANLWIPHETLPFVFLLSKSYLAFMQYRLTESYSTLRLISFLCKESHLP